MTLPPSSEAPVFQAPQIMHDFLHDAAARLGYRLHDAPKTGWYARSISQKAEKDGRLFWLQLRRPQFRGHVSWLAANNVRHVIKPELLHHETARLNYPPEMAPDSLTDAQLENADSHFLVFSYCDDTPVSPRAWQTERFVPDLQWWHKLRHALEQTHASATDICAIPDDFILEQLKEHFDYAPRTPIRRHVVHGDLHWGNVGRDMATLYDWELYGTGPYGYDVSLLYFYSYLDGDLSGHIRSVFASYFEEKDFYLTLLFTCAAVLRIIPKYPILQRYEQTSLDLGAQCLQRIS